MAKSHASNNPQATLDSLMILHVLTLATPLLLGADTALDEAALLRKLAHESELSCKQLGLTDMLATANMVRHCW